jgi:hypothetical protein
MLTAVLTLVGALTALATLLFVAVVVGIRREPPYQELSSRAPGPVSAMVRRLLGVSVRKPADADPGEDREACLAGHTADRWDEDGKRR